VKSDISANGIIETLNSRLVSMNGKVFYLI